MKELPIEFKRSGFVFNQIKRVADLAVFCKCARNGYKNYEVIKIQKRKESVCFGSVLPEHEAYPYSESWGTCGWSAMTLEAANCIFDELLKAEKK